MKKAVKIPEGKPTSKWSTRQLRAYIRNETAKVNERINTYRESNTVNKVLEIAMERLKSMAGVKGAKGREIGLGLSYKLKSELLRQARGLESFEQIDVYTPQAIEEQESKYRKQYESFKQNYGYTDEDLSFSDYLSLADDLGTVGSDVLGTFNYMGVVDEVVRQMKTGRKINLVRIIEHARREFSGQGKTNRELVDRIIEDIRGEM